MHAWLNKHGWGPTMKPTDAPTDAPTDLENVNYISATDLENVNSIFSCGGDDGSRCWAPSTFFFGPYGTCCDGACWVNDHECAGA